MKPRSLIRRNGLHWSRFVVVPASWLLDRIGKHSTCDDLDNWAAERGWWHR